MISPFEVLLHSRPEWQATIGFVNQSSSDEEQEQQLQHQQCWLRAAVKHAKLLASLTPGGRLRGLEQLTFLPLHVAASQGMTDAGRMILERANNCQTSHLNDVVNMADALGCTPLHWAAIANRVDFVLFLLDHGAEVDNRDCVGRTPLFSCAAFGAVEAAVLLLQRNANQNAEDGRGLTPLHAAAAGGHLEVANELISAGADVRSRALVGSLPRHVAERQGHVSMVELLVNAAQRLEGGVVGPSSARENLCPLMSQLRASVAEHVSVPAAMQQQQQ